MQDKRQRWRPLAVAAGLMAAGVVAVVMAAWVVDDLAVGGPTPGWFRTFVIGVLLGVIAVVGLRNRRAPALGCVLAAVSLGLTTLAVFRFVAQYKLGFPAPARCWQRSAASRWPRARC